MFALRHKETGKLMGFTTSANNGEFCVSVEHELDHSEWTDNVWVTSDRTVAEVAATTTSKWYNAGFSTPKNSFVGQLEVVELKLA